MELETPIWSRIARNVTPPSGGRARASVPRRLLCAIAALLLALPFATHAQGTDWPQRPVRLVVPAAPGGSIDILARQLGQRLSERLGQPFVVENRGGGGGDVGFEAAARAPADGYTLLLVQTALVVNPALRRTTYDPVRDFAPVIGLVQSDLLLVAGSRFPARNVAEVLEVGRTRPAGLICASGGGLLQLACEVLKAQGRLNLTTLPYKGVAPALHDVAIGEADIAFTVAGSAAGHVQAGRLKVLGSSDARTERARATGVPPIAEALPGFNLISWQGVVAPAGMPRELVARIHREFAAVLADPETRRKFVEYGFEITGSSADEFGRTIARDAERFSKLVDAAGIRE